MIYLAYPDSRIEACEREANASRLEARGFVRCPYGVYRLLWRRKDRRQIEAMREAAPLIERQVGGPSGWTKYGVDGKEVA